MSKIHYFQRYNSKENWVTNATLLLLSRLYHYDKLKFETVINSILIESSLALNIGVDFSQQQWRKSSIVDGVISQESFKVIIETKLLDNFSVDQLIRHLDAIEGSYSERILLALSKNKVDIKVRTAMTKTMQNEKYKGIKFASTTYEDIYQIIDNNLSEYDLEMKEILYDYISLCSENKLTNIDNRTMLVFTAGESLFENLKYDIYYDPITRKHNSPFKYIGLYKDKAVKSIGILNKTVYCDYDSGKLVATNGYDLNQLSKEEYERILGTIENTGYYDLKLGMKFFLVDKFYDTNYIKTSFSSIRAKRYFWLDQIEGFKDGMTSKEVAQLLDGRSFI